MASPCQVKFYCESEATAKKISTLAIGEARRLEEKYSRYLPNSITSKINQSAGKSQGIILDAETCALLNYANTAYEQSEQLFDITSGVFRKIWDFKSNKLPDQNKINQYLLLVGWDKAIWNAPHLTLPLKGMEIDFGGYVKEYAADALAKICTSNKIKFGLVNMGGDIKVFGPHPDGKPWQIGIQDPLKQATKAIATINISSGCLASSGDYERFIIVNGKRYSHIINPKTGWPLQNNLASVSVLADQCLIAGTSATIAMLKEQDGLEWLRNTELKHLCIDNNGEISTNTSV